MIYLDPRKIDIFTTSTTINFILENFCRDGIRLCSNRTTWKKKEQSRFIESLILKLPVGSFYFDGSDMDKWDIVDGYKRLISIRNYVYDRSFELSNLEYLLQYNGLRFDQLDRYIQRRIEEYTISIFVINTGTPIEIRDNLYKRLRGV